VETGSKSIAYGYLFYTTAQLIAAVIMLIQDLDGPTAGFIKTQPMIDTAASIAAYAD
jgi:hypothetical protein